MIWVSTSGIKNLANMWFHTHYQAMIPYKAIPGTVDPEPSEPTVPPLYLLPVIDGQYLLTVVDSEGEQVPYIDSGYGLSVKDIVYEQPDTLYIDHIYLIKEIIVDGTVPPVGTPIVTSEGYNVD